MAGLRGGRWEVGGKHVGDWFRKIKEKDHLEDMNVDGKVILILVLTLRLPD